MDPTEAPGPSGPIQGGTSLRRAGRGRAMRLLAGAALTTAIFLVDALTTVQGAIAVLYVVVLLLAADVLGRRGVSAVAAGCAALTVLAHLLAHGLSAETSPVIRCIASLGSIGIMTGLVLRNQAFTFALARQVRLLDLTHDAIFVQSLDGVISYWNRAAEKVYGWSEAEVTGRVCSRLLRSEFPEGRAVAVAHLLQTGRWEGEILQTTRDGRQLLVACRWVLLRDGSGAEPAIIETNTDITERRRAEAALARSERRYRAIFEKNGVSILEQDWSEVRAALDALQARGATDLASYLVEHPEFLRQARGLVRITGQNAVAQRLLGGDAPAERLDQILPDTDRTFAQTLLAIARGDSTYQSETRIRTRDGRSLDILFVIAFPARAEEFTSVLVSLLDISGRKATEQALLAAQRELAHTARVTTIGALTSSIAHEINQPLAAIVTDAGAGLRWLRRPEPDLAETEAALERIMRDGRRAAAIVGQARSFLAKGSLRSEPVDLAEAIREAVVLVERDLQDQHVALRLHLPPGLPRVPIDRVQVQQVVINLIANAAQAMAGRLEPLRELTVRAQRQADGQVLVEVQDRGSGIAPELLPRLFEPFQTTRPGGMGLGLPICRSIVEAHGGRLWASSDPGRGATFRFTLPTDAQEAAA